MPRATTISDALRKAVAEYEGTQKQLCELAEIDRVALYRFVRGERTLTLDTADRLVRVLGLELTAGKARNQENRRG